MTQQTPPPVSRAQRTLAFIAAALVVVSLVCFAAMLIGGAAGAMPQQGSGVGLWPAVIVFPLVAFPVAFVLIIVVIILSVRQRRTAAKAEAEAAALAAAKPKSKPKGRR
ncbi:hypothetical protein [Leifsonia shinshuensis]|uniref:hypothetical protein n=1 Tax=Leifsonia shinshuensis TaxID=150026 RepID=UPI001F51197A|nr:hypothetical protein [Leifsonia shinshuensis]